jgi:hypothetical protein
MVQSPVKEQMDFLVLLKKYKDLCDESDPYRISSFTS